MFVGKRTGPKMKRIQKVTHELVEVSVASDEVHGAMVAQYFLPRANLSYLFSVARRVWEVVKSLGWKVPFQMNSILIWLQKVRAEMKLQRTKGWPTTIFHEYSLLKYAWVGRLS